MAYSLRQRLIEWERNELESEMESDDSATIDQFEQLEAWFANEANIELIVRALTVLDSTTRFAARRGESQSLLGLITTYFADAPKTQSVATGVEIARWCGAQPDSMEMDEADVDSLAGMLIDEAQNLGLLIDAHTVCLICRPRRPEENGPIAITT